MATIEERVEELERSVLAIEEQIFDRREPAASSATVPVPAVQPEAAVKSLFAQEAQMWSHDIRPVWLHDELESRLLDVAWLHREEAFAFIRDTTRRAGYLGRHLHKMVIESLGVDTSTVEMLAAAQLRVWYDLADDVPEFVLKRTGSKVIDGDISTAWGTTASGRGVLRFLKDNHHLEGFESWPGWAGKKAQV